MIKLSGMTFIKPICACLLVFLTSCVGEVKTNVDLSGSAPSLTSTPFGDSFTVKKTASAPFTIDFYDRNTNGDVDSDGDVIDYECYVLTNNGKTKCQFFDQQNMRFDTRLGYFEWRPQSSTPEGVYELEIKGGSGLPKVYDTKKLYITVTGENQAPEIESSDSALNSTRVKNITQAEKISNLDFNQIGGRDIDLDGEAIHYSFACTTSGGLQECRDRGHINPDNGVFSFVPNYDDIGEFKISVIARDDFLGEDIFEFVVKVDDFDFLPAPKAVMSKIAIDENQKVQIDLTDRFTGTANDRDNEAITYNLTVNGDTLDTVPGINFANGKLIWTPTYSQAGSYAFAGTASAGASGDIPLSPFVIEVADANQPPSLANVPNVDNAAKESPIEIDVNDVQGADVDIEGEVIAYTCTYSGHDIATNKTVTDAPCNTLVSYDSSAPSSLALRATFDEGTGVLKWTPHFYQSGDYTFTIVGVDERGGSDSVNFVVALSKDNLPPLLPDNIGSYEINEGENLLIDVKDLKTKSHVDRDKTPINYTCHYNTSGPAIVSSPSCDDIGVKFVDGYLSWTPGYDKAADYNLIVIGSDGVAEDSTNSFAVKVHDQSRAPQLKVAVAPLKPVYNYQELITIEADDINTGADTDLDGEAITYSCSYVTEGSVTPKDCSLLASFDDAVPATPTTAAFNTSTGTLSWKPVYTQVGEFKFIISGADIHGVKSEDVEVFIQLQDVNQLPAVIGNPSVNRDGSTTFSIFQSAVLNPLVFHDIYTGTNFDRSNKPIEYSATCLNDNGTECSDVYAISINGEFTFTANYDSVGVKTIAIRTHLGDLNPLEFKINVQDVNHTPSLNIVNPDHFELDQNSSEVRLSFFDQYTRQNIDRDGEQITYSLTCNQCNALSPEAVIDGNSGVFVFTPKYNSSVAIYQVAVKAVDASGNEDVKNLEFNLKDVNFAPAITIPQIKNLERQTIILPKNKASENYNAFDQFTQSDFDRDGEAITYSLTCTISGVPCDGSLYRFNAATGDFQFLATDKFGTYEFVLTGNDTSSKTGTFQFYVNVDSNANLPPRITEPSGPVSLNQSDYTNNPAYTFDFNQKDLNGDVDENGDQIVYSFTCVGPNDIACEDRGSIGENDGVFKWTPRYDDLGKFTITVQNVDVKGARGSARVFNINVLDSSFAPVLPDNIQNQNVDEGVAIAPIDVTDTVTKRPVDRDAYPIKYSCLYNRHASTPSMPDTDCQNIGVKIQNGVFTWTPGFEHSGVYRFKISGEDEASKVDTNLFDITVANVNLSPNLKATVTPDAYNGVYSKQVEITVDVNDMKTGNDTDADGEAITYSCTYSHVKDGIIEQNKDCTTLPAFDGSSTTFDASTGVLKWTPDFTAKDVYTIKVKGDDQHGGVSEVLVDLPISKDNLPPELKATVLENYSVEEEQTLTIDFTDKNTNTVFDRDNEKLVYTVTSSIPGPAIDPVSGQFTWKPSYSVEKKIHQVIVEVTDGNVVVTKTLNITVTDVDLPPVLTNPTAVNIPTMVVDEYQEVRVNFFDIYTNLPQDRDGTPIVYSVTPDNLGVKVDGGVFVWTPDKNSAGKDITFTISGTDGTTAAEAKVKVQVNDIANLPPVIDPDLVTTLSVVKQNLITVDLRDFYTKDIVDRDGEPISYNLVGNPSGVQIKDGILTWRPLTEHVGTKRFEVQVTDSNPPSEVDFVVPFTITVKDGDVPPMIGDDSAHATNEGELLVVDVTDTVTKQRWDGDKQYIKYTCYYAEGELVPDKIPENACSNIYAGVNYENNVNMKDEFGVYSRFGGGSFYWHVPSVHPNAPKVYTFLIVASDELNGCSKENIGECSPEQLKPENILTDERTLTVTVGDRNLPPVLPATVNVNQAVNVLVEADVKDVHTASHTDRDGENIQYSCTYGDDVTPCTGVTFVNGVFTWQPAYTDVGTHYFNVVGTDNTDNKLVSTSRVTVQLSQFDYPPSVDFENAPDIKNTVSEGGLVTFNVVDKFTHDNTDRNGQTITYSVTDVQNCSLSDFTIEPEGTILWDVAPLVNNGGVTAQFKIVAKTNAGAGNEQSDSFIYSYTVEDADLAPVLNSLPSNQKVAMEQQHQFKIGELTDPDGSTVNYTVARVDSLNFPAVTPTVVGGQLTINPRFNDQQYIGFKVIATSTTVSVAKTTEKIYTFEVDKSANLPPEIADPTANINKNEGDVVALDAKDVHTQTLKDRNGEDISFECFVKVTSSPFAPGPLSLSEFMAALNNASYTSCDGSGLLKFNLDVANTSAKYELLAGAAGKTVNVVIVATDSVMYDFVNQVVTVADVNLPPAVAAPEISEVAQGEVYTHTFVDKYTASTQDRDGNQITYSLEAKQGNGAIDPSTGVFTYTPNYNVIGVQQFKLKASDGVNEQLLDFSITVLDKDFAPELPVDSGEIEVNELAESTHVSVKDVHTSATTDRDGTEIVYTCKYLYNADATPADGEYVDDCSLLGADVVKIVAGEFSMTPTIKHQGYYKFKIIGTTDLKSDFMIIPVHVINQNAAPTLAEVVAPTEAIKVNAKTSLKLTGVDDGAVDLDGDVLDFNIVITTDDPAGVGADAQLRATVSDVDSEGKYALTFEPNFSDEGKTYHFAVTATEKESAQASSNTVNFDLTIENINNQIDMRAFETQYDAEQNTNFELDLTDKSTGTNKDRDGETIEYICTFEVGALTNQSCDNLIVDGKLTYNVSAQAQQPVNFSIKMKTTNPADKMQTVAFTLTPKKVNKEPTATYPETSFQQLGVNFESVVPEIDDPNIADIAHLKFTCSFADGNNFAEVNALTGDQINNNCDFLSPGLFNFNERTGAMSGQISSTSFKVVRFKITVSDAESNPTDPKSTTSEFTMIISSPLVFDWTTDAGEFHLPFNDATSHVLVDWGDGSDPDNAVTHTYNTVSNLRVKVLGYVAHLGENTSKVAALNDVVNLGDLGYESFENAFNGAVNLNSVNIDRYVSSVTNMANMFSGATKLRSLDVKKLSTANVTTFAGMFNGVANIGALDLSRFNLTKATDVTNMLEGTGVNANSTVINLNGWEKTLKSPTGNLFSAQGSRIYACSQAVQAKFTGLACWEFAITPLENIFVEYGHTSSFDVNVGGSDTAEDGTPIAYQCLIDVDNNGVYKDCAKYGITRGANGVFTINTQELLKPDRYVIRINANGKAQTEFKMFLFKTMTITWSGATGGEKIYVPIDTNSEYYVKAFLNGSSSGSYVDSLGKSVLSFDAAAGTNTVKVTGFMEHFDFRNAMYESSKAQITAIDIGDLGYRDLSGAFAGLTGLTDDKITEILTAFNPERVTKMSEIFMGTDIETFAVPQGKFVMANVTDVSGMFKNNPNLHTLDLTNMVTTNVENFGEFLRGCTSLTNVDSVMEQISVAKAKDLSYMFADMKLTSMTIPSAFNTASVESMRGMFSGNSELASLDLTNLNTSNVKDMSYMFANMTSLSAINLVGFNTASATNMSHMFERDYALSDLDLSAFTMTNVVNMDNMLNDTGYNDAATMINVDWKSLSSSFTANDFAAQGARVFVCDQNIVGKRVGVSCWNKSYLANIGYVNIDASTNETGRVDLKHPNADLMLKDGQTLRYTCENCPPGVVVVGSELIWNTNPKPGSTGLGSKSYTITVQVLSSSGSVVETKEEKVDINFYRPFIGTWKVSYDGQVILPILLDAQSSCPATYDFTVDWGDGTTERITNCGQVMHTYTDLTRCHDNLDGTWNCQITLKGFATHLSNINATSNSLIQIDDFGYLGYTSLTRAFYGSRNLAHLIEEGFVDESVDITDIFTGTKLEANGELPKWYTDRNQ